MCSVTRFAIFDYFNFQNILVTRGLLYPGTSETSVGFNSAVCDNLNNHKIVKLTYSKIPQGY